MQNITNQNTKIFNICNHTVSGEIKFIPHNTADLINTFVSAVKTLFELHSLQHLIIKFCKNPIGIKDFSRNSFKIKQKLNDLLKI